MMCGQQARPWPDYIAGDCKQLKFIPLHAFLSRVLKLVLERLLSHPNGIRASGHAGPLQPERTRKFRAIPVFLPEVQEGACS